MENKFLNEAEKYGLLDGFWKLCEQYFGYTDVKPTLEKLVATMFITYTAKYIGSELFIVTADHGFIYKRDKIAESDKIEGIKSKASLINRRFLVSPEPVVGDGIVSMVRKITNKITILDFIQSELVSDVVKGASYRLFFVSDDNERISDENSCIADSHDQDASKCIFCMKFQFKDKQY